MRGGGRSAAQDAAAAAVAALRQALPGSGPCRCLTHGRLLDPDGVLGRHQETPDRCGHLSIDQCRRMDVPLLTKPLAQGRVVRSVL